MDIHRTLILEGQRASAHNTESECQTEEAVSVERGNSKSAKKKHILFFALSRKCNTGSHRRYSSTVFRMLSLCRTSFHQNVGMKKAPICFRVETDWRKTYDKND